MTTRRSGLCEHIGVSHVLPAVKSGAYGVRNKRAGELWEQDTMVIVHSTTKGLAAMTLLGC